jgi:hypothetical protein
MESTKWSLDTKSKTRVQHGVETLTRWGGVGGREIREHSERRSVTCEGDPKRIYKTIISTNIPKRTGDPLHKTAVYMVLYDSTGGQLYTTNDEIREQGSIKEISKEARGNDV